MEKKTKPLLTFGNLSFSSLSKYFDIQIVYKKSYFNDWYAFNYAIGKI